MHLLFIIQATSSSAALHFAVRVDFVTFTFILAILMITSCLFFKFSKLNDCTLSFNEDRSQWFTESTVIASLGCVSINLSSGDCQSTSDVHDGKSSVNVPISCNAMSWIFKFKSKICQFGFFANSGISLQSKSSVTLLAQSYWNFGFHSLNVPPSVIIPPSFQQITSPSGAGSQGGLLLSSSEVHPDFVSVSLEI